MIKWVIAYHVFPCGVLVMESSNGFLTEIVPNNAFDWCLWPVSSSIREALFRDSVDLLVVFRCNACIILLSVSIVRLTKKRIMLTQIERITAGPIQKTLL